MPGRAFFSPTMQRWKRNHALRRAEPCKLRSPTMQVAELNHASLRVHGSARASPSIEYFFGFLTWILAQRAISTPISRARVRALSYNSDGGFAGFDLRGLTPINSHDSETLRCDGGRGCITASECRAVKTRREEWVNSGKKWVNSRNNPIDAGTGLWYYTRHSKERNPSRLWDGSDVV
jgi:hypothetical protein